MNENEVLFQISNLVNGHLTFPQAVEQISLLLQREADAKAVIFHQPGALDPVSLLGSFRNLYRSLYSVDLRSGGQSLGQVTLCFASDSLQPSFERLAEFVGEQLGMLLARTKLAERRCQLREEIVKIREDLATRKLFQRAEGLLISHRGMTQAAASRWIAQQSQNSGLAKQDVADRIIAYHRSTGFGATGFEEQRIA
jgi:hypothetical protein